MFSSAFRVILIVSSSLLLFILSASADANGDEWYVRLHARSVSENLSDSASVLGASSTALDEYDSHDLPELAPFSSPFLTVVFRKTNWDQHNGEYNSDFRSSSTANAGSLEWRFVVKSDDPDRDVELSWESEHRLDRMRLVDLATGTEFYPVLAGRTMTYRFNMNGSTER